MFRLLIRPAMPIVQWTWEKPVGNPVENAGTSGGESPNVPVEDDGDILGEDGA